MVIINIQKKSLLSSLLLLSSPLLSLFSSSEITYFAANITLSRTDPVSVSVSGIFHAEIKNGELLDPDTLKADFETLLLGNHHCHNNNHNYHYYNYKIIIVIMMN